MSVGMNPGVAPKAQGNRDKLAAIPGQCSNTQVRDEQFCQFEIEYFFDWTVVREDSTVSEVLNMAIRHAYSASQGPGTPRYQGHLRHATSQALGDSSW